MYHKFFGLTEDPFNMSPDPRFFYLTDTLRETLSVLSYGIKSRKGFILLTGGVGTGKTTILNVMLQWLRANSAATAFIHNPRLSPEEFLDYMMKDFGIPTSGLQKGKHLFRLNEWLLKRHEAGQVVVLVVDEAQQLSTEMLEELRLLTNFETPTQKLLQIVLAGQPELDKTIRSPGLRQLRQRIALRCKTVAFTLEQTRTYIRYRLETAGAKGDLFDADAIAMVHRCSGGIGRVINLICNQALIGAYCEGLKVVNARLVEEGAKDLEFDEEAEQGEQAQASATPMLKANATRAGAEEIPSGAKD
jgi:type II secretory pathway predicted ATPase ExeA